MFYTYILESQKNGKFYIGYTKDLSRRVDKHNAGHTISTKSGIPWQLVWSHTFESKTQAMKLEKALKRLKNKKMLRLIIAGKINTESLMQ
jgi:putative endonuclease